MSRQEQGSSLQWRRLQPQSAAPVLDALRQGVHEFNTRQFFECHETLEDIWRMDHSPARNFYKGIIQIAAALHHLTKRHNYIGAVRKLESGARYLEPFVPMHLGLEVERLIADARRCRQELMALGKEKMSSLDPSLVPRIIFHPDLYSPPEKQPARGDYATR